VTKCANGVVNSVNATSDAPSSTTELNANHPRSRHSAIGAQSHPSAKLFAQNVTQLKRRAAMKIACGPRVAANACNLASVWQLVLFAQLGLNAHGIQTRLPFATSMSQPVFSAELLRSTLIKTVASLHLAAVTDNRQARGVTTRCLHAADHAHTASQQWALARPTRAANGIPSAASARANARLLLASLHAKLLRCASSTTEFARINARIAFSTNKLALPKPLASGTHQTLFAATLANVTTTQPQLLNNKPTAQQTQLALGSSRTTVSASPEARTTRFQHRLHPSRHSSRSQSRTLKFQSNSIRSLDPTKTSSTR
jgi:hypothetical protein